MTVFGTMLEAQPVSKEVLTPKQYLAQLSGKSAHIKSATIVPPRLGSRNFGGVLVEYKTPQYRVR